MLTEEGEVTVLDVGNFAERLCIDTSEEQAACK